MKLSHDLARVILVALALGCTTTLSSTARAQEDDPATEMARDRFKEGVRYYDQKQYEKARAAFLQAYALKQHPAVLLNLAQSELRSGHEADAATHFAQYLREAEDKTTPEYADADKALATARQQVAEIQLNVEPGADVLVDGENRGKSPLPGPLYLAPGSHRLEARKGDASGTANVQAEAGRSQSVSLKLAAGGAPATAASPASPTPSEPSSEEEPAAEVELDTGGGHESFTSWFGHTPLAWIGAGLSVVGLGGGIGFSLAAKSKYDGANALADEIRGHARQGDPVPNDPNAPCANPSIGYREPCDAYLNRVDNADTFKTLSIVGFAVGGAAAAGTIVYYFLDREAEPASAARRRPALALTPLAGPSLTGAVVSGSF